MNPFTLSSGRPPAASEAVVDENTVEDEGSLHDDGVTRLTLPVMQLAVIIGMAGVAGVLAATSPARRAARLDVLDAIASE